MKERNSEHDEKVAEIAVRVAGFYKLKKKFRIYHGSTNSTRSMIFDKDAIIDTSRLDKILEINAKGMSITVEPNVSMDQLVNATLKHNLVPQVVMELPGITVGGGIQGGAGESSSFKYGGFHESAEEYELILGDGTAIIANRELNSDIFWGTACSYGSVAVLSKVKLNLVPAKQFVKLTYIPVESFQKAIATMYEYIEKPIDFIDGIMITEGSGLIMVGVFSEKIDLPIKRFARARDEWFYIDALKIAKLKQQRSYMVPIRDYFFRYDRGGFWAGTLAAKRIKLPLNRLTKFMFNPLSKTRTITRALQLENISQQYIIQDLCMPKQNYQKMYEYVAKNLNAWPLWMLPMKMGSGDDRLSPGYLDTELIMNIGIYGEYDVPFEEFKKINRQIEAKTHELGGRKTLYAHNYYSRKEFWSIYDQKWYELLRRKYNAETVFPDIYSKTNVNQRYSGSPIRAVVKLLLPPYRLRLK